MFTQKIVPLLFGVIFLFSCSKNDRAISERERTAEETRQTNTESERKDVNLSKDVNRNNAIFEEVVIKKVAVSGNISDNLHDNLSDVFDKYVSLKNELAENDSVDSRKLAYDILDIVMDASKDVDNRIDANWTLVGDKLLQYRKIIENSVTLKDQREWFGKLTATMTEVIQQYGIPDKTIYELSSQKNTQGISGNWLTDSKNSDDPYNGKSDNTESITVLRGWQFD